MHSRVVEWLKIGFQTILVNTSFKYFKGPNGEADENALWLYEGIVMPGGQMMVGRWWCEQGLSIVGQYSGPFIMWATDDYWKPEVVKVCVALRLRCGNMDTKHLLEYRGRTSTSS